MMIKSAIFLMLCIFLMSDVSSQTYNGVKISKNSSNLTIENPLISITYNLQNGTYSARDKARGVQSIYNASSQINGFNSNASGLISTYAAGAVNETLGKGASLTINSKKNGEPDQLLKIKLFENQAFVILQSGIKNSLREPYVVKKFSPVSNASIFKGLNLSENFRVLDGEGGGIETYIRKEPTISSQNNMVLSFGNETNRYNLVAGGLTYQEFEKFATLSEEYEREPDLLKLVPGLSLVEYIDLGDISSTNTPKHLSIDKFQNKTKFKFAGSFPQAKSIIYDSGDIKIQPENIDRKKSYTVGIVWGSNYSSQKQSVILSKNGKETEILPPTLLPDLSLGKEPQLYLFELNPDMMQGDMPTFIIRKDGGSSTVLSEIILFEGKLAKSQYLKPLNAGKSPSKFKNVQFNLFAEDPIGKRVQPGQTYLPEKDAFYLDFSSLNPMTAAENYALRVKRAQNVKLNPYFFPTICLWYAMQPLYGGGAAGTIRAINDSPGAVDEMRRVKASGWLKYTTMGIRLVPDCYAENNENGWWDDSHWQKYGSGSEERQGTKEMALEESHYRKPYETTKKWAGAVRELGGLPFFYFQTGVRSKDYAEQFPGHMLHNQSFYKIGGKHETLNFNLGSYDFTDVGFAAHMRKIYSNLNSAGIVGIMFDYPHTAWAPYGGMDDKYATAGSHYRRVFELAANGLGEWSYNQERNITRGSDITAGVVESQRIWGDIDVLTAEMVMRGGLRWYKNRVLFNYDMDAKSLTKAMPSDSDDGINKLLTMSYVSASRLLLGQSFAKLSDKHIYKLSRIFPYHSTPKSARPIDAFSSDYPRVYDFPVNRKWHQVTFYNEDDINPKTVSIALSGTPGFGGMGLDKSKWYYVYDFWNNQLLGKFQGSSTLSQNLRKGEARMTSVREVENHPQVLSTDRHVMQGYIELSDILWKDNRLSGTAEMVENEPMKIIIATNGMGITSTSTSLGTISHNYISPGLLELTIISPAKGKVKWVANFKDTD